MRKGQRLGWERGVNLLVDEQALPDNMLANGRNCWPTQDGVLAKRQAVAFERVAISDPSTGYKPIAMFIPDPTTGFDFVIHYAADNGDEYLRAGRFDGDTEATTPSIKVAAGGPYQWRPMSFCNYRGAVIAVGAGNEGFFQLTQSSGTGDWAWHRVSFDWTAFDAASPQTQSVGIFPRTVGVYRDRLVFANFGNGRGHWLIMADRAGPWAYQDTPDDAHRDAVPLWSQIGADSLALNGHHIEVVKLAGQEIRVLEEVATQSTASALQQALLILTDARGALVQGEIAESTDPGTTYQSYVGDWTPAVINMDCGVAGNHAITRTPNGVFWASGEDVYALYDGSPRPVLIGTNIRPALRACPNSFQPFWHMAYADGAVYLSVATQNSTNELNLSVQHWRLDLRPQGDGEEIAAPRGAGEARWWGPQDYESLPTAGLAGSVANVGACIAAKRGADNNDTVYGLWFGTPDPQGSDPILFLVSFNRFFNGRDIPYKEISSARQWTATDPVDPTDVIAVGDVVMPSPLKRNGHLFVCTAITTGKTGAIEPNWPTAGFVPTLDGGVYWDELTLAYFDSGFDSRLAGLLPNASGTNTTQRIALEPDFKEYDMGTKIADKVLRRTDVAAYFSVMQQAWMEIVLHRGDKLGWAGPCVIGQPHDDVDSASNELGSLTLDSAAIADEFQARRMSPSGTSRDRPTVFAPGVVRGLTLQPRFREGDGFVIDSTNDYIVWCVQKGHGFTTYQAAIPDGYYVNMDTLMTAIVLAMNGASPVGAMGGAGAFTVAANPWSFDSAFAGPFAYMTNLKLAFSARGGDTFLLLCAATDPLEAVVFAGVTTYVQRSQRLLAMLGFDTTNQYGDASGIALVDDNGVAIQVTGEKQPVTATPAVVFGIQSVPYTRSAVVAISDLQAEFTLKPGRPMALSGRRS